MVLFFLVWEESSARGRRHLAGGSLEGTIPGSTYEEKEAAAAAARPFAVPRRRRTSNDK